MRKDFKLAEEKADLSKMMRLCGTEHDEVRRYVLTKPLKRPRTSYFSLFLILGAYTASSLVLGVIPIILFHLFDQALLIFIVTFSFNFMIWLKFISIKLVECYQHYAKEETRRRCLCKPTCSEYALAVLKKHSIFVALHKIRVRLFKTCKGGIYVKDEP